MQATIKKWGNSYAIRLTRRDLDALHLRPGQRVRFEVAPATGGRVDLSGLPTFRDAEGISFDKARAGYYADLPRKWKP